MKSVMVSRLMAAIGCLVIISQLPASAIEIVSYQAADNVVIQNNISMKVLDVKNIDKGGIIAINILVENKSDKPLGTGEEDFTLSGLAADTDAIPEFITEKSKSERVMNMIPYVNTIVSFMSTQENDILQDIIFLKYHGGLVLPGASKSGYVLFRKATLKDFKMYAIYEGQLLTFSIPVITKPEPADKPKKEPDSK